MTRPITANDRIKLLAQAMQQLPWSARSWSRLSDGERRLWMIRARMEASRMARAYPDAEIDAVEIDAAMHQQATGKMEVEGTERWIKGRKVGLVANVRECPLSYYEARKLLSPRQVQAGRWLYEQFVDSGRTGPGAAPLDGDRVDGNRRVDMTERQMDAAAAYEAATRHCGHLSPVLVHVCVLEQPAKAYARRARMHDHAGMPVLRIALDTLADWIEQERRWR